MHRRPNAIVFGRLRVVVEAGPVTALLVLTGLLLLVSGAVKARAGLRAGLGIQLLTLVELAAALVWCGGAAVGAGTVGAGAFFVPVGVLLVLVSSAHFWTRMSAYRRERAQSEARRLENYVKYLAGADDVSQPDA